MLNGIPENVLPPVTAIAIATGTITALPFFGVGAVTLGMSVAGSMIAFAYGSPVKNRFKLFGYAVGGTFIGVWGAQLIPLYYHWDWYSLVFEPPLAGFVALISRWVVPFFVEQMPAFLRRVFNMGGDK